MWFPNDALVPQTTGISGLRDAILSGSKSVTGQARPFQAALLKDCVD
jgi:hypothetical protein